MSDELQDKMTSSAYVMTLSPGPKIDHKIALETGMAILLDKPIVVVGWEGAEVPPGLARIAHRVVDLREPLGTDAGQQQLQAELAAIHAAWPIVERETTLALHLYLRSAQVHVLDGHVGHWRTCRADTCEGDRKLLAREEDDLTN